MEQKPENAPVGAAVFTVCWHPGIKQDLKRISPETVEDIVTAATLRLTKVPQFVGQPLKGTDRRLWKIRFGKYRLVFTIDTEAREVWALSVQRRDVVYRDSRLQRLLRVAIALHTRH